MIEFIKHTLGFCGEPHPNIFMIGAPAVSYILYKFKFKKNEK